MIKNELDTIVANDEHWCLLVAETCTTLQRQNLQRVKGGSTIWCSHHTYIPSNMCLNAFNSL